ncbi:alpha/beta-Hydrolases superfamily protein [Striga hermonthica]|uniref:Alpha/beta-Hydrolases superfamily protein n=1 Tax=Striga hermonthica TaxID=68872 RepID=A0A9N7RMA1_STRHE|nr:alpha/beta-Hydrolases superfamily protein [Striga hermonthica]
MATCNCPTMAMSKLSCSAPLSHKITHKNSPSCLSTSRGFYLSQGFVIPRTYSGFTFSRRNDVFSATKDDFSVDDAETSGSAAQHETKTGEWKWRGYSIRYQYSGSSGPALVLVHGFGANSDHWRKNLPVLAQSHRVYAIDLLGYGYSDKPNPQKLQVKSFYTFETWGSQLNDFCVEIVKDQAFFDLLMVRNAGIVGLQAAVMDPTLCKGIILLNISLRMLHITKQPWYGRPLIKSFQNLLRWNTALGKLFFKIVATPESVRNILCQCYYDKSQVTDELVKIILDPGLDPGAADVFLEFICYSGGPLPEELLPQTCFPPKDEAPDLVNPLVTSFVDRHKSSSATLQTAAS